MPKTKKHPMEIISNGSKWGGEAPDPIDDLYERLKTETLGPHWHPFLSTEKGQHQALGNFHALSAVFNVRGTKEEMAPLVRAIRNAMERPEYLGAVADLLHGPVIWPNEVNHRALLKKWLDRRTVKAWPDLGSPSGDRGPSQDRQQ